MINHWNYKYIKSDVENHPHYEICTEKVFKNIKFVLKIILFMGGDAWVLLSSGKKRRDLSVFEAKQTKNLGCGIEPLLWVKRELTDTFPEYYKKNLHNRGIRIDRLFIGASDSRRMRIYKRALEPHGYRITTYKGIGQVLFKKI